MFQRALPPRDSLAHPQPAGTFVSERNSVSIIVQLIFAERRT
jgi:hypothetical protein